MIGLSELVNYTNSALDIASFQDYCPNGLQVEGRAEVRRLVTGVTASQALIDAAIDSGADAIVVHHGYFWKGESPAITGLKRKRLQALMQANVSLLAYHLPLDAHADLGNNVQLARQLGVEIDQASLYAGRDTSLVMRGRLKVPMSAQVFSTHVAHCLDREPMMIEGGSHDISTIAWCSGAAQGYIDQAVAAGADLYLSGEVSEQTWHLAREYGIHYCAAGHHATERYGIQALGRHLAAQFALEHEFIEITNPI